MVVDRRIFHEFLATYVMVFLGCGSIKLGWSSLSVSITFGLAVLLMIFVFGSTSGAHMNPAVSIALWKDQKLDSHLVGPYIAAQCSGAFVAALCLNGAGPTTLAPDFSIARAFAIEWFITFLLMAVILICIRQTNSIRIIGFFVGLSVAVLAFCFGEFTGASMNPARTFGPNIVSGLPHTILFYFTSTILGAYAACLFLHQYEHRRSSISHSTKV